MCQRAKSHRVHLAETLGQYLGYNDQNHDLSFRATYALSKLLAKNWHTLTYLQIWRIEKDMGGLCHIRSMKLVMIWNVSHVVILQSH